MSYILDTKYQTKTIFLNSLRAQTRNPFNFKFTNIISCPYNMNMVISVEELTISNTFNNIHKNNDRITFNINGADHTLIFPHGLYNAKSFVEKFNLLSSSIGIIAVYDYKIFKISFVSTVSFSIVEPTTLGDIIGLKKDDYNLFEFPYIAGTTPTYSLFMHRCVDFSGTPYLFIKSNDLILQNINSYGFVNNTICRVPINAPFGYKIFYRPTDSYKFIINNPNISNFNITIENELNQSVEISGEFQMLLKINYIYTPDEKTNALFGTLENHIKTLPPEEPADQIEEEIEGTI